MLNIEVNPYDVLPVHETNENRVKDLESLIKRNVSLPHALVFLLNESMWDYAFIGIKSGDLIYSDLSKYGSPDEIIKQISEYKEKNNWQYVVNDGNHRRMAAIKTKTPLKASVMEGPKDVSFECSAEEFNRFVAELCLIYSIKLYLKESKVN